jgi:nucleotidyltransferase substrate binding protein (TIGR01987 family)
MNQDIRWQQRHANYQRALTTLTAAVELSRQRPLSELEQQGLIQAFEYTHELAWNCLKDFLHYQGERDIFGSRDATRKAFAVGLIEAGEVWMDMIGSRNRSSHTYNKATADAIVADVIERYHQPFQLLDQRLTALRTSD